MESYRKGESEEGIWGLKEGRRDESGKERGIYGLNERRHLSLTLVLL